MKTSRSEDRRRLNSEKRDKRPLSKRTREKREEKMKFKRDVIKLRQLTRKSKPTKKRAAKRNLLSPTDPKKSLMSRLSKLLKWRDSMRNTHLTKSQTKSWTTSTMISTLK